MPLVRFEVRNEYGLGQPELYRGANREDPKAVLDGVAVAGLVGILRQLGDLSEFAAEVFHGLQEQVMSTASRSHKLMVRVQNIEAALPSLEKAVLAQTSHIHFAYTAGSEWQPRIKIEQNHFIYNDLPRFIMDSYEECHDPPRLHLLDKFDAGGPGACLRRYSDPTFFRRVSGNSSELDVEKVQKAKKTRKNRKSKPSQRNGDLHYAPMLNDNGRVHFTDTNNNERTSSSHTASTNDITQKSDQGDHSNSFDSRNASGINESVFHINSDVLAGDQESKELSSSLMLHNNIHDPDFSDRKSSVSDDHSLDTLTPGHVVPSSSNVTWDEKEEIVNPKGQHSDAHETPDMVAEDIDTETDDAHENPEVVTKDFDIETDVAHETPVVVAKCFDGENEVAHHSVGMVVKDFDLETEEQIIFNLSDPNQLDMVIDDVATSSFINNQHDEVESEPENYMDALNTIESESDVECPKRLEAEKLPSNTKNGANNEKQEVGAHILDHYPVTHEYDTRSGISSPDSKDFAEQKPHVTISPSGSDHVPDIVGGAGGDAPDCSKTESVVTDPSSCGSVISNVCQEPLAGDAANGSCRTHDSQAELQRVNSVTFWTNGGLLGLEPSKPPDFAVSKAANHDNAIRSNGVAVHLPGPTVIPGKDEEWGKHERLAQDCGSIEMDTNSKFSTLWQKDRDARVQQSGSHLSNQSSHDIMGGLDATSSVTPLDDLPVNTNAKSMSNGSNHDTDEDSSQFYGFSRRLLANGFYRKMPLVLDNKPQNGSSEKKNVSEQMGGFNNIAFHLTPQKELEEQFERKPYVDMVTSSPPLEHMKISFHPIDDFEASKLKLKFPDASHNNECTRDMFASFQLVPEPAIQLHDDGLISDDDTFCRSSPYESDDGLGHNSESESEQWESGESPENKDNELYDAWCRISPGECIPSSLQPVELGYGAVHLDRGPGMQCENGVEPSVSACLDLPSFEALNPVLQQGEGRDGFDKISKLDVQNLRESKPSPPPLPPVQWCVTKLPSDVSDDKQHPTSAREFSFDPVMLQPIRSQQAKPSAANKHQNNMESITLKPPKSRQQDEQKLNFQEEAKQPASGRGTDEKEDFLQQIRSKSFSLRRTVTTRPNFPSGPTTNDNVTAILVKANAIRQAVGSDDGEDEDSWSDT